MADMTSTPGQLREAIREKYAAAAGSECCGTVGTGADVLICARRVGPPGRAIGLDMTDEMLSLARANAAEAGLDNVEFVKG